MRKIVIAGSAKFYKEVLEMKKELENNDYNVMDYPKNINVNIEDEYKQAYERFYESLSKTDDLILFNLDKNGIATIEQQRAFLHAEYGTGYAIGTGYLDADQKTVIMQIQFLVDLNGQWGIVSGTAFEESFTIPER